MPPKTLTTIIIPDGLAHQFSQQIQRIQTGLFCAISPFAKGAQMLNQSLKITKLYIFITHGLSILGLGLFSIVPSFAQESSEGMHWGTLRCQSIHMREFIRPAARNQRNPGSSFMAQYPIFLNLPPFEIQLRTSGAHPAAESIGASRAIQPQTLADRSYRGRGNDTNPISLDFGVVVQSSSSATAVPHCREDGTFQGGVDFVIRSTTLANELDTLRDSSATIGMLPTRNIVRPLTTLVTNHQNTLRLPMNDATGFPVNQRVIPFLNQARIDACRPLMAQAQSAYEAQHDDWEDHEETRRANLAREQARRNRRTPIATNLLQPSPEPTRPNLDTVCANIPASAQANRRVFGIELSCDLSITEEAHAYCQSQRVVETSPATPATAAPAAEVPVTDAGLRLDASQ